MLVTWHSANGCAASTSTSSSAAARGAAAISCARGRGTRQRRVGTGRRAWRGSARAARAAQRAPAELLAAVRKGAGCSTLWSGARSELNVVPPRTPRTPRTRYGGSYLFVPAPRFLPVARTTDVSMPQCNACLLVRSSDDVAARRSQQRERAFGRSMLGTADVISCSARQCCPRALWRCCAAARAAQRRAGACRAGCALCLPPAPPHRPPAPASPAPPRASPPPTPQPPRSAPRRARRQTRRCAPGGATCETRSTRATPAPAAPTTSADAQSGACCATSTPRTAFIHAVKGLLHASRCNPMA